MNIILPVLIRCIPQLLLGVTLVLSDLSKVIGTATGGPQQDPLQQSQQQQQGQDSLNTNDLNIHIVPHSHDDVGWLKTVEQIYYGQNSTIQHACVSCILDTVVLALQQDANRKFTFVEIAFFAMWWKDQTDQMKEIVKTLVNEGQLSFANGGWCMHDEATTHFIGMMDQTTLGHEFLKRELNYVPTVGWQLDPFGHSSTQASLLTSLTGFNSLFFGRIDYQDLNQRRNQSECEGIWDSSPNLRDTSIFWGLTGSYNGNYGAPDGFCFDILCDDDPLVGMEDEAMKERVLEFLKSVRLQVDQTKGNNIMMTMGSDFQFQNAFVNYKNLDDLFDMIRLLAEPSGLFQEFDTVNIFYSTPEQYTQHKYDELILQRTTTTSSSHEQNQDTKLSIKTDDFFPYADCKHCYWSGHFTSRPGLKRHERVGSSFLHVARQIQSLFMNNDDEERVAISNTIIFNLESAVGVAQHHDALTGTEKQHVAYDYAKKVQAGINDAAKFVADVLKDILKFDDYDDEMTLEYCQLLNETKCSPTQIGTSDVHGDNDQPSDLYVVLYNSLGWTRRETMAIPVSLNAKYIVERRSEMENVQLGTNSWTTVGTSLMPVMKSSIDEDAAPFKLFFDTDNIPPVGLALYRIRQESLSSSNEEFNAHHQPLVTERSYQSSERHLLRSNTQKDDPSQHDAPTNSDSFVIDNHSFQIHFESGMMKKVVYPDSTEMMLEQEFGYYTSYQSNNSKSQLGDEDGDDDDDDTAQLSGAYIFRPSSANEELHIMQPDTSKTRVIESELLTEVHIECGSWIKQVIRIVKGAPYVDFEYTIGPIPIDDLVGKEIVTRYRSGIESKGVFWTDSNGREFMRRERSKRQSWKYDEYEPIAGNYYPVNAAIYIEDDDYSMAILTDRTQGAASLRDGNIEVMIQRRLIEDDARGVNEPLNETDGGISPYPPYGDASRQGNGIIIKGLHRQVVGRGRNGASLARGEMDAMFHQMQVFAGSMSTSYDVNVTNDITNALKYDLPSNVQLLTVKVLESKGNNLSLLVRYGHAYAIGESDEMSTSVTVDLSIMKGFQIKSVVEKTLSGNQNFDVWQKKRMKWEENETSDEFRAVGKACCKGDYNIELYPMEIRTFRLNVERI